MCCWCFLVIFIFVLIILMKVLLFCWLYCMVIVLFVGVYCSVLLMRLLIIVWSLFGLVWILMLLMYFVMSVILWDEVNGLKLFVVFLMIVLIDILFKLKIVWFDLICVSCKRFIINLWSWLVCVLICLMNLIFCLELLIVLSFNVFVYVLIEDKGVFNLCDILVMKLCCIVFSCWIFVILWSMIINFWLCFELICEIFIIIMWWLFFCVLNLYWVGLLFCYVLLIEFFMMGSWMIFINDFFWICFGCKCNIIWVVWFENMMWFLWFSVIMFLFILFKMVVNLFVFFCSWNLCCCRLFCIFLNVRVIVF